MAVGQGLVAQRGGLDQVPGHGHPGAQHPAVLQGRLPDGQARVPKPTICLRSLQVMAGHWVIAVEISLSRGATHEPSESHMRMPA